VRKGLIKKASNEKIGNPKNGKGLIKKTLMKKRQSNNHQLIKASSTNLTLEEKGDAFWFSQQVINRTKAIKQTKNQITISSSKLAPLT
jgi:hypothetical protein